jgi:hypothetical protein
VQSFRLIVQSPETKSARLIPRLAGVLEPQAPDRKVDLHVADEPAHMLEARPEFLLLCFKRGLIDLGSARLSFGLPGRKKAVRIVTHPALPVGPQPAPAFVFGEKAWIDPSREGLVLQTMKIFEWSERQPALPGTG